MQIKKPICELNKAELKKALETIYFAYLNEDRKAWANYMEGRKFVPNLTERAVREQAMRAYERRWGFQYALEILGVCFEYDEKEDKVLGIKHFGVLEELK